MAYTFSSKDGPQALAKEIFAKVKSLLSSYAKTSALPTKASLGISNVKNYDQSKAITSITRSGTTFTATALDGTKTTFTQQDSNTTYGVATQTANGLMSAADKKKLDGISDYSELSDRLSNLEYMLLKNDLNAPINVGTEADKILLVDSDGKAILANWHYEEA